jgi:hypothetical protein
MQFEFQSNKSWIEGLDSFVLMQQNARKTLIGTPKKLSSPSILTQIVPNVHCTCLDMIRIDLRNRILYFALVQLLQSFSSCQWLCELDTHECGLSYLPESIGARQRVICAWMGLKKALKIKDRILTGSAPSHWGTWGLHFTVYGRWACSGSRTISKKHENMRPIAWAAEWFNENTGYPVP